MIHTTAHHPFWDETAQTWVDAAVLTPGHQLHTSDGTVVTVAAVATTTGVRDMHNLTVDTTHTYYVEAGTQRSSSTTCGEAPWRARAWSLLTRRWHETRHQSML